MVKGYNTYVGARYVPIFDGEWDINKEYEPLVIVSNEGNSYTSKTYVPSGVSINNTNYWSLTGNYNAQVEYYRRETAEVKETVDNLSVYITPNMFGDANTPTEEANRLQLALDYAYEHTIPLYIPSGTYIIDRPLIIKNGVHIIGCGDFVGTTIQASTAINIFQNYAQGNHITIEHIRLFGNDVGLNGIYFTGNNKCNFVTLRNVQIERFTNSGLWIDNIAGANVYNCRFYQNGNFSAHFKGNNENSYFKRCWFANSLCNCYIENGGQMQFDDCWFTTEYDNVAVTNYCVKIINSSNNVFNFCSFESVYNDIISHVCIDRDSTGYETTPRCVGNILSNCRFITRNKNGNGIEIGTLATQQNITPPCKTQIKDCRFLNAKEGYYDILDNGSMYTYIYNNIGLSGRYDDDTPRDITINTVRVYTTYIKYMMKDYLKNGLEPNIYESATSDYYVQQVFIPNMNLVLFKINLLTDYQNGSTILSLTSHFPTETKSLKCLIQNSNNTVQTGEIRVTSNGNVRIGMDTTPTTGKPIGEVVGFYTV